VIVLDAGALIAFLNPSDELHGSAVTSLIELGPGRAFGISPITHAEVLVGPARAGTLDATEQAMAALGVSEVALPMDAARRLATLRVRTALKLPDCCVILAAQAAAGMLLTFDDRLAKVAVRLGVSIEQPASDHPSAEVRDLRS
jgi:predicted nucleic acid-binding protein